MNAIYVEKTEKSLKYFITGLDVPKDNDYNTKSCGEYLFQDINTIDEKAFFLANDVKKIFFDENLMSIKKEAFKNCSSLEIFCCGSDGDYNNLRGIKISELAENVNFSIETSAFVGCENLNTVILPKCHVLKIEKNAFSCCTSLRTVVALSDEIKFTENPFEDCPKELVFICTEGSAVEQFARENGYRSVNV